MKGFPAGGGVAPFLADTRMSRGAAYAGVRRDELGIESFFPADAATVEVVRGLTDTV
jgi:hypothetical protein